MGSFKGNFPIALFVAAAMLTAQSPTGEIRLSVRDPSGTAMRASGSLSGAAAPTRSYQTDAQGNYDFSSLPYGHYQLEVSGAGFSSQILQVDVKSPAAVLENVTMALAASSNKVDVVSATPLAGTDLSVDQIPGPVQTATAEDIAASGALSLTELMDRRLNGVFVNDMAGSPFQTDVNFRGYTASPILGTPEGISVYVDGVRQNQPFGDVVAWDLISKKRDFGSHPGARLRPSLRPEYARRSAACEDERRRQRSRCFHYGDLWRERT